MNPTAAFDSLADWLLWLETLSPREIVLGLDRVHTVLDRLALERPATVVHIGGTNGKGSSAAMLEAMFLEGGSRTGCYTSPHMHSYNERIRIDGSPADDDAIVRSLRQIEAIRGDVPLTYFEFGTLAALLTFHEANVEAWILEVGLGGRLDAVNAIDPDVSLITNISLDHCAWLGNDRESIAKEKAGIMRATKPVVFGSRDMPASIARAAGERNAILLAAGDSFTVVPDAVGEPHWTWRGRRLEVSGLNAPSLPGDVQLQNAAAVLALIESLGMDHLLQAATVNRALSRIDLAGRFQLVQKESLWVLDVAHNPAAAQALAIRFGQLNVKGRTTAIVGMLTDKDIVGVIDALRPIVDRWIAVTVNGARAEAADFLAGQISNDCGMPCRIAANEEDAMQFARTNSGGEDVILVTGSFYVVGPALTWLDSD